MKKLLYLGFISILFFACNTEPVNTLKVSLEGVNEGTYYLTIKEAGEWINIDSANIKNGSAIFDLNHKEFAEVVFVQMKGQRSRFPVFIENSKIEVIGDKAQSKEIIVKGSASHDEYKQYLDKVKPFDEELNNLYQDYSKAVQEKNNILVAELNKMFEEINGKKVGFSFDYIIENPASVVSAYVALSNNYYFDLEELEEITAAFDASIQQSTYIQKLNKRVEILQNVAIGKKYIDFTMNDIEGNPVALSTMVGGKYVLLDFWASWCGPCRRENPNVVAVYNEFKDKGFDIVGISLDKKKEDWLKAIEDDKLTWHHISDLAYWNSAAAALYGVNSIPHSILLDTDGVIIAKNLKGEGLRNKMAELLN